jgi:hypothetical protein
MIDLMMRASRSLSVCLMLIASCAFAGAVDDLESLYQRMALLQKQIGDLQKQYDTEKLNNDQRVVRINDAKSKGNNYTADVELQEGYESAERLSSLNALVNDKHQQIEKLCGDWRSLYGLGVDELLANAEKEKNGKKKAEIGSMLQKYQSLNSQLCVQAASIGTAEWKSLQVAPYDGPQEINQKVQLLKDISREISIQLTRLDEQHKQSARERRTRDRAQEFIEEGTLFEGGVNVRTRATGSGVTTSSDGGNGPVISGPGIVDPSGGSGSPEKNSSGDAATTGAPDSSTSNEWHHSPDFPKTEKEYKVQRAELIQQQEELRKKIQDFEAKQQALIRP